MQIAIITDIHGNIYALEQVLRDCEVIGVDNYWFLGDYVAMGAHPRQVIDRIRDLPNAIFIRGNTDRYLYEGVYPPPSLEEAEANVDHNGRSSAFVYGEVRAGFA